MGAKVDRGGDCGRSKTIPPRHVGQLAAVLACVTIAGCNEVCTTYVEPESRAWPLFVTAGSGTVTAGWIDVESGGLVARGGYDGLLGPALDMPVFVFGESASGTRSALVLEDDPRVAGETAEGGYALITDAAVSTGRFGSGVLASDVLFDGSTYLLVYRDADALHFVDISEDGVFGVDVSIPQPGLASTAPVNTVDVLQLASDGADQLLVYESSVGGWAARLQALDRQTHATQWTVENPAVEGGIVWSQGAYWYSNVNGLWRTQRDGRKEVVPPPYVRTDYLFGGPDALFNARGLGPTSVERIDPVQVAVTGVIDGLPTRAVTAADGVIVAFARTPALRADLSLVAFSYDGALLWDNRLGIDGPLVSRQECYQSGD